MIGGMNGVSTQLANIYSSSQSDMASSLSKIASGKRIQNPSDDFAGYMKASSLTSDVARYAISKQDLQNAKGMTDYAKKVGGDVLTDLNRMKELKTLHSSTTDANEQAAYAAEYDAIGDRITSTKANSKYDNTAVYATGNLKTVTTDPDGSTLAVTTTNSADETGLTDISADTTDDIQTQINAAATYLAEVTSSGEQIGRQMNYIDTAVSAKEAAASAITDVDDVKELQKVTDLQVRQTAAVSMISQANMSRQGVMRLFM